MINDAVIINWYFTLAHPIPEYTSIVIRQTSPSSTLLQPPPQQDIEEVAIESLPEMVTELFDSISNQPTVAALPISSAPMTKKILSSSQIKLEPSFSVNNTNSPAQPLSSLAVNTSTVQQLSSSISMDPNGNDRQFCVTPSNKSYHLTGANNQSQPLFNSYWLKEVFTVDGIVPVCNYSICHIWHNSTRGYSYFDLSKINSVLLLTVALLNFSRVGDLQH